MGQDLDGYLARAEAMEALAAKAADGATRVEFLLLAEQWRALAAVVSQRRGEAPSRPEPGPGAIARQRGQSLS